MKKLAIIIALALLATSSMYPMEPAKDMTVKTPEEKKFQPKLLKDLALSKVIMNNVQPALDQLTIETFHDVRDALLTFCNESKLIENIPIEGIIKVDSKEEIPYKILALIMKAYNVSLIPEYSGILNLEKNITDFLIYVLYKNMPDEEYTKYAPKECLYINDWRSYRDLFIYIYLNSIVARLTARNIDEISDEIEKFNLCDIQEKINILKQISPELATIRFVRDYPILKALRLFGNEVNQFLSYTLKSANYLKVASLHKTAEKLRQDYQAIINSDCFVAIQSRLHKKDKDNLTKTGNLLRKNIYALKYEL